MFFLNLTATEFFSLLGVLGSSITALYLLDRSRRKKYVSSLRFWAFSGATPTQQTRKHVNQPWSLLLQLLSLLLLLSAVAQLQLGDRSNSARDHVLLLDTSAWSMARLAGGTVLDAEIREAETYIGALPAGDRVMLARVDALTTPVVSFTQDRDQLITALRQSRSNGSALDLPEAFAYASSAQHWSPQGRGEVIYVGPARISLTDSPKVVPSNLRILPVAVATHNLGITGIMVSQEQDRDQYWRALITLYNYADTMQVASLRSSLGQTRFATRTYSLRPHQTVVAEYVFLTSGSGVFTAEVDPRNDSIKEDNRAAVRITPIRQLRVGVYTDRRQIFEPLLSANPRLRVDYLRPNQQIKQAAGDVLIFDGFAPALPVGGRSLWVNPPRVDAALPVRAVIPKTRIQNWGSSRFEAFGLRPTDDTLLNARIFQTKNDDISFGQAQEGPVVVLHAGPDPGQRSAIIGYDPLQGNLRFTVTTPLLFANLLQWLSPALLREPEAVAGRVGATSLALLPGENVGTLQILDESGPRIPAVTDQERVSLFVNQPATLHAVSNVRDEMLFLTLPDVAEGAWTRPDNVAIGIPPARPASTNSFDLWKWLAGLGAAGLIAEWFLFGAGRRRKVMPAFRTLAVKVSEHEREVSLR